MNTEFENKLKELETKLPAMVKRIPGVVKAEGLQFIADNFEHEGFEQKTGSYRPWARKKRPDAQKKVLIGEKRGGSLFRSWKNESTKNDQQVAFRSSLPYAQVHNEGGKAGRGKGFIMQQRQMIGPSEALDRRIGDKIDRIMNSFFK